MKSQENPHDDFLKSLFQESEERTNLGVTEKVMVQIQGTTPTPSTVYKPPITRLGWISILGAVGCLLISSAFQESTLNIPWPDFSNQLSIFSGQLRNTFNWNVSLPKIPKLSTPFLAAILAFNVAGMYFALTYWKSKRA